MSCISSDEEGREVVEEKQPLLSCRPCISSEGGGERGETAPSIWHFERGRGRGDGGCRQRIVRTKQASNPSISCLKQGRGGGGVVIVAEPLHLVCGVRWWWNPSVLHLEWGGGGTPPSRIWSEGESREVVEGRQPPPSCIWSEGGSRVVVKREPPPSRVSSEGGSRVVVEREPPLSCVSSEVREGVGWWWRDNLRLTFRVRKGVGWWWKGNNPCCVVHRALSCVSSRISCVE